MSTDRGFEILQTSNDGLSTWQMYKSLSLSIYLPAFLMSLCQSSLLLALPLFALELGGSVSMTALVFALRGLGNMTADVPAGYGASRFGDKFMMLVGIGAMVVVGLLTSFAESAWQLAGSAFCFGCAMATWLIARLTHISEFIPDHHRGKAISTMAGLQRFGSLLGPVASGLLAYQFGFQYVFLAISMVASIALLLVILHVPKNEHGQKESKHELLRIIPNILINHRRTFLTAGIAIFFLSILRAGRHLLIPIWGHTIGLNTSEIGLIASISAGADMVMFPLAGYMTDNWGRKHTAVACMSVLSFALLLIPWSATFTTLCLFAVLAGVGNGLGSGINMTLGSDFAPRHERGEFLGVWRLTSDTGSFGGPLLVGFVTKTFQLSLVFPFLASLGLIGVLIVIFLVRETLSSNLKARGLQEK